MSLHWALGFWVVSVVSATVWSVHRDFPWDPKESPLLQIAGVAFVHATRTTLFVIPMGLVIAGLGWALKRSSLSSHPGVHTLTLFLGSVILGVSTGLWIRQPALAVVGACAGATGAMLALAKGPVAAPRLGLMVLAGCALAIALTW